VTDATSNKVRRKWSPRRVFAIISIVAALVVLGTNVAWRLLEWTNSNVFCGSCHEMGGAVGTWTASTHTINRSGMHVDCIECHLPPKDDIVRFSAVKGATGLKDVMSHLLERPYDAETTTERLLRTIPDLTCTRCHEELFSPEMTDAGRIAHRAYPYPKIGQRRNCLSCHPQVGHKRPIVIEPPETREQDEQDGDHADEAAHEPPTE